MPKLTNSQKAIFAILTIVVLYAVYDLVLFPAKPKVAAPRVEGENLQEMKELAAVTAVQMAQLTAPAKYERLISRAEARWEKNPFIERAKYNELIFSRAAAGAAKKAEFVYAGYIDLGNKKMAIINSVEYNINESLENEGYILREVFPGKVVIEDKANRHRFEVPLQE